MTDARQARSDDGQRISLSGPILKLICERRGEFRKRGAKPIIDMVGFDFDSWDLRGARVFAANYWFTQTTRDFFTCACCFLISRA
jgi:hypothetical protein